MEMSTVTQGNISQWKIKQPENKVATCRDLNMGLTSESN